jgi:hypothetical protein
MLLCTNDLICIVCVLKWKNKGIGQKIFLKWICNRDNFRFWFNCNYQCVFYFFMWNASRFCVSSLRMVPAGTKLIFSMCVLQLPLSWWNVFGSAHFRRGLIKLVKGWEGGAFSPEKLHFKNFLSFWSRVHQIIANFAAEDFRTLKD